MEGLRPLRRALPRRRSCRASLILRFASLILARLRHAAIHIHPALAEEESVRLAGYLRPCSQEDRLKLDKSGDTL